MNNAAESVDGGIISSGNEAEVEDEEEADGSTKEETGDDVSLLSGNEEGKQAQVVIFLFFKLLAFIMNIDR